jgi:hypothetical protein
MKNIYAVIDFISVLTSAYSQPSRFQVGAGVAYGVVNWKEDYATTAVSTGIDPLRNGDFVGNGTALALQASLQYSAFVVVACVQGALAPPTNEMKLDNQHNKGVWK